MQFVRAVVLVLTVLAAVLTLAPAATAATAVTTSGAVTAEIRGVEYAATSTQGRFGGAASGPVPGAWLATVDHDPLQRGRSVPITGGSFVLRGAGYDVSGRFVQGRVVPLDTPSGCGNERFDVTGTLALRGGGRGTFTAVLTHLRVRNGPRCVGYGAVVVGSLTVPSRASAT